MWNHWVARTNGKHEPFQDRHLCQLTWRMLRQIFPDAIAAVLMPNHIHILASVCEDDSRRKKRLSGALSVIAKKYGRPSLWQPVPEPEVISHRDKLSRQIRYIALNPCRKNLCSDPLEWEWSSYREVMGAAADPWIEEEKVAMALGQNVLQPWFHRYVSSDPSVSPVGTPLPTPSPIRSEAWESLGQILAASAACLRVRPQDVRSNPSLRLLFVHLARRQGWWQIAPLAQMCGLTPRMIHYLIKKGPPPGVPAAALCLGDLHRVAKIFLK